MTDIYLTTRAKLDAATNTSDLEEVARLLESKEADAIPPAKFETLIWDYSRKLLAITGALA